MLSAMVMGNVFVSGRGLTLREYEFRIAAKYPAGGRDASDC